MDTLAAQNYAATWWGECGKWLADNTWEGILEGKEHSFNAFFFFIESRQLCLQFLNSLNLSHWCFDRAFHFIYTFKDRLYFPSGSNTVAFWRWGGRICVVKCNGWKFFLFFKCSVVLLTYNTNPTSSPSEFGPFSKNRKIHYCLTIINRQASVWLYITTVGYHSVVNNMTGIELSTTV